MLSFMNITKALADENRVRVLLALGGRELCLCQIIEVLGLAPSTVSKHMSILRQAGLIKGRKAGRWMYYRLAGNEATFEIRAAIAWTFRSLSRDAQFRKDATNLEKILCLDPEGLCRKQVRR